LEIVTRRAFSTLALLVAVLGAHVSVAQEPSPLVKGAQLTILQINDVYETTPVDGRGGLARVATLKQQVAASGATPFVMIAGDFLSSSVASTVFKGRQMIDAFNAMGLDLATLGNHEFDFGKEVLLQRMAESRFQYIVANVLDDSTGRPVGGAAAFAVRTFGDLKVGFFGLCLVSEEIGPDRRRGLRFLNPLDAAATAIESLRSEGVQAIVALTHLSYEEDRRLAERFPDITVIVGGHEHFPVTSVVDKTLISKAGSDAKFAARIDLHRDASGLERHFTLIPIDSTLREDPRTAAVVADYEAKLGTELEAVVARSRVPLDGEARHLRSAETNLGNLVADAIRANARADIAIVNSGSIRGDRVYRAGPITRRNLLEIHPFGNIVCKLSVSGRIVLDALNSGVSKLPAAAGQFPQVSGLTMRVAAAAAVGNRVQDVRIGGQPLDPNKMYTLAIPDFMLGGGDGYTMFANQAVLIGPQSGDLVVNALEVFASGREVAPSVEGRIVAAR
jgi:5'-nucleotidase